MSRCIVCDYCRETDGGNRRVEWSHQHNGPICSVCRAAISVNLFDMYSKNSKGHGLEEGEVPFELEDDYAAAVSVEGLDILEEFGVEKDSS